MKGSGPTRVGDLVGDLLKQRGVDRQVRRVGALDAWAEAVGEKIADVTNAKTVVASTLFVEVKSSAWLMELDFMKAALLEHLNERLEQDGAIERIVLTLMEGDG